MLQQLLNDASNWLNAIWIWLNGLTDTIAGTILFTFFGIASILVFMVRLVSNLKLSYNPDYSRKSREANMLALGLLPLKESGAYWNDPTGGGLDDDEKARITQLYDLRSSKDVYDRVVELLGYRLRRDGWQEMLAARARATRANGGRKPTIEAWLAEAKHAGGSGRGEQHDFAHVVETYEKHLGRQAFPHREPVVSFDGYALSQAVAISTWGVGLGLITEAESLGLIEQVNEVARAEFHSWEEFGRSFILGQAMHWSDGTFDQDQLKLARRAANRMYSAMDDDSSGEWDPLPWQLPLGH